MNTIDNESIGRLNYTLFSEEDKFAVSYGISAEYCGQEVVVHNITTVLSIAGEIYRNMILNAVMPVHLKDVISDIISG